MIAKSVLFSIHLIEMDDGRIFPSVVRSEEGATEYMMEKTGYWSASLCLEEVASLVDSMLFTWLAVNREHVTQGATG